MTSAHLIHFCCIAIIPIALSTSGAEATGNARNARTDLITTEHSWQDATSDQPLSKSLHQFAFSLQRNETHEFRTTTHKTEKWKELLASGENVCVGLLLRLQEQTITNIYKMRAEMNLAEFMLLYDIVNTTSNCPLINDIVGIVTKCNLCAQSTGKGFPTTYFCHNAISKNWIHKTRRPRQIEMSTMSNSLRIENMISSLMPRIFASATEQKYHDRLHHSTQQSRSPHKARQNSRSHHELSKYRRKHHIYIRKHKLLKLQREQEAKRKIRKKASDILKVPIGKRKLLCKYRKSCYNTSVIPDTWNIRNILPPFLNLHGEKSSENEKMTDVIMDNEKEEKEEISEAELKLLCRYRKSCYEEMGAKIEKSAVKAQPGPILSRISTNLPVTKQKSTKEIARVALAKIQEKEEIAALRSTSKKVIIDRNLNQMEEKMKKRLACKYRKSCYNGGIPPKIDMSFDISFQKIYNFLQGSQKTGIQEIIPKEFKDFNDNKKKIYCKYRKSCYKTAQKPAINHSQIFKYTHVVEKYERVIPLKIRCKYRKSCYDTGILPNLNKRVVEETQPVVPVQIATSLHQLKAFCKYRKSCYKRKAEEQQNLNFGPLGNDETLDEDESERKKEEDRAKEEIIKSLHEETTCKTEKTKELNASKKMEYAFEKKPIKDTNSKRLVKKLGISISQLEGKNITSIAENEKSRETALKLKKMKTKDPLKETPIRPSKKDQKIASPTIVKQSIIDKRTPERIGSKKKRSKTERTQKNEKIAKEKKILEPLPTEREESMLVKKEQSMFLEAENRTLLNKVNIHNKSLSPITIKLLCKYRKSCYKNGMLPSIHTEKTIAQGFQENEDNRPLEIRCKYRKSCYETGKLPENLHESFKIRHLTKNKENIPDKHITEEHIPLTLRCKYRKSCYKTGKLPPIEASKFWFSTIQILKEYEDKQSIDELSEEQLKMRCKYRKSCYESGILPPYLNHTAYVVATTIKQYENPQLKCKYRKSCYENMELDIKIDKVRKQEKQKKAQEGIVIVSYQTEPVAKHKEKEQEENAQAVTDEEDKRTRKKKSKESKSEAKKEHEFMQIKQLDSHLQRKATKPRSLNSTQKLKCKYRIKCYDSVPFHEISEKKIEKQRQLSIKDFRRANGAICNKYYISCRKQAGLPILQRAPIGPNGRRLCRKKKKEETSET
ncbi:unnamed protein product [Litomosoides sigmodontis]|uniref:Uncharacterized protein n=1 Tax=Litomosoides sigmodontis TaxID=42156 RepID=A0A3P6U8H5_LITSI|nr:unnamed protein product [Litomosoides sigmodontis]